MEQEKQKKLIYIMEHAADNGYDTSSFNRWLESNQKGTVNMNIQTMTYAQVVSIVAEYQKSKTMTAATTNIKKQDAPKVNQTKYQDLHKQSESVLINKQKQGEVQKQQSQQQKKTQITKSIRGKEKTEINLRQLQVDVLRSEVIKSGIFSSDEAVFHVQSEIPELSQKHLVLRKDQDFYTLRQVLLQIYPYTLIPPLPPKSTKTQEKELSQRVQMYNRFLIGVSRSEVLKSCKFVVQFLTIVDRKYWKIEVDGYLKIKYNRKIENVVSLDGFVSVEERGESKRFCDEIKNFSQIFSHITKEAIQLSKEVNSMSEYLALSVNRLALCIKDLGKLYTKVKIPSQSKLFSKLSDLFVDTSVNFKNLGHLTKIYCGQAMKYYELEHQPLEELLQFREQFRLDYLKFAADLEQKKNQLFKQDLSQWGYTKGPLDDIVSRSLELIKDKNKAFKFMLTAETQKLNEMGEELCFYTNQCLDETRRVGRDNGEALIDHFMDQGKIQCGYLQRQFDKWSEFVAYFGSLEWEKPIEKEKRKKRKKDDDGDFELIDDVRQSINPIPQSLADQIINDDDGFELVSANRASIRTTQIMIEKEPEFKVNSNRVNSGAVQDIGASLKSMQNQEERVSSGNQNSTDQTSEKESTFLIAAPTVYIKRNKKPGHKTAPVDGSQNAQSKANTTTSNPNRMTEPFDNLTQQVSDSSLPIFGTDLHTPQNDPSSLSSGSSQPQISQKSQQIIQNNDIIVAQNTDVIPEESEHISSDEPTLRNDTIVMDMDGGMPKIGDMMQKERANTHFQTKAISQRPAIREQTITDQIKQTNDQISQKNSVQQNQPQLSFEDQIKLVQSKMKPAPQKQNNIEFSELLSLSTLIPEEEINEKIQTIAQPYKSIYQQSKLQVSSVKQVLNTKRQSILTQGQIGKLNQDNFLSQVKLRPVPVIDKNSLAKKQKGSTWQGQSMTESVAQEFKQESAIQRAIRKITMNTGENTSDEEFEFDK